MLVKFLKLLKAGKRISFNVKSVGLKTHLDGAYIYKNGVRKPQACDFKILVDLLIKKDIEIISIGI